MELNHRFYELNVSSNLDGQNPKVLVNGEDRGLSVKDIFRKHSFETGRIVGWSILEYYTIQDGYLTDKEGNKISLSTEKHPEIKFTKIRKPLIILNEIDVTRNYIRDVGTLLNLEVTEETITGLSKEDKKVLQDERALRLAEIETKQKEEAEAEAKLRAEEEAKEAEEAKLRAEEDEKNKKLAEEAKVAETLAKKAAEEAEQAAKEAEKARQIEEKAKEKEQESIEKAEQAKQEEEEEFILNQKEYERIKKRSEKNGMTEYVKDGYHFFYGADLPTGEIPFIIGKRDDNKYEELAGGVAVEDDEVVEFEFDDGDKEKVLILEFNDGENPSIKIEDN